MSPILWVRLNWSRPDRCGSLTCDNTPMTGSGPIIPAGIRDVVRLYSGLSIRTVPQSNVMLYLNTLILQLPYIFLKDDLLRRCRTDHCREPPEMGRAPVGPARVADIVPEQECFEAKLGVFEITEGIFTGSAEVADGFVFHLGDIDQGEITRAR